ncbi:MAG: caspase family protein [Deltaproteobacteria bacterium]|nr:caspase family protein [Deltaproteobacteria bacterium]
MCKKKTIMALLFCMAAILILGSPCFSATGRTAAYPPSLFATVSFKEDSGNKLLDAEEQGEILVAIKNSGRGDAFGVQVMLEPLTTMEGVSVPQSVDAGTIRSGETKKFTIPLSAEEGVTTASRRLKISFTEANGFDADPVVLAFNTRAMVPPDLVVADVGIDDLNQNGRIEPTETVEVTARIQNRGSGEARNVLAEVTVGKNVFILPGSDTRFPLGDLAPGAFKDIQFTIFTNKRIKAGPLPVKVNLDEARPRFSKEISLTQLALNRPQKRTREIIVEGVEIPQKIEIKDVATLSVDVDDNLPRARKQNKDGIAVIIGNRDYHIQDVPRVDFAIRDAAVMREYVINALGFRPGNIIYYENATQANFRTIFGTESDHKGKLFSWVKPGRSDVFIYYSGHGAPDPRSKTGYFVPTDCDPSTVRLNGYSLKTFYANLAKLPARSITVVLDSCFSGGSPKGMLLKNVSPVFAQVDNPLVNLKKGAVFTSSTGDQVSSWYPEKRHGLFTYFFLKGLQGSADSNGDKRVTASEMKEYLKDEVSYMARRLSMREQHPQFMGNKEAVIIKYK